MTLEQQGGAERAFPWPTTGTLGVSLLSGIWNSLWCLTGTYMAAFASPLLFRSPMPPEAGFVPGGVALVVLGWAGVAVAAIWAGRGLRGVDARRQGQWVGGLAGAFSGIYGWGVALSGAYWALRALDGADDPWAVGVVEVTSEFVATTCAATGFGMVLGVWGGVALGARCGSVLADERGSLASAPEGGWSLAAFVGGPWFVWLAVRTPWTLATESGVIARGWSDGEPLAPVIMAVVGGLCAWIVLVAVGFVWVGAVRAGGRWWELLVATCRRRWWVAAAVFVWPVVVGVRLPSDRPVGYDRASWGDVVGIACAWGFALALWAWARRHRREDRGEFEGRPVGMLVHASVCLVVADALSNAVAVPSTFTASLLSLAAGPVELAGESVAGAWMGAVGTQVFADPFATLGTLGYVVFLLIPAAVILLAQDLIHLWSDDAEPVTRELI